jgi:hypothetical protein
VEQASGGTLRGAAVLTLVFAADGLVSRIEWFEPEQAAKRWCASMR